MADFTISGISATASVLGPTDLFEIEQAGVSKKITASVLNLTTATGCWNVISASMLLVAAQKYATDTSSGGFTATLPLGPTIGDCVVVSDAQGAWATGNLTIGRNGQLIAGLAENLICDVAGRAVELVFVGGAAGWAVFNSGT